MGDGVGVVIALGRINSPEAGIQRSPRQLREVEIDLDPCVWNTNCWDVGELVRVEAPAAS